MVGHNDRVWTIVCAAIAAMFFMTGMLVGGVRDTAAYEQCNEDQVWTWYMDYQPDYPDNVEWECVYFDDLMHMHAPH